MEQKGHFINVLPDGGLVIFLAVAKERDVRPKRSGGFYLHLLLADRTGDVPARVWDSAEETAKLFGPDDVVKVRGRIERYNRKTQLIVQRIRHYDAFILDARKESHDSLGTEARTTEVVDPEPASGSDPEGGGNEEP